MAKIIVKMNGNKGIVDTINVNSAETEAVRVKAQAGVNYELQDQATGTAPENVMVQRSGNDLLIAFEGSDITQPDLIIEDYYGDAMYTNLLIGMHENGRYYTYTAESGLQSDNVVLLADHISSGQALSSNMLSSNFYSGTTPASSVTDSHTIATNETHTPETHTPAVSHTPDYPTSVASETNHGVYASADDMPATHSVHTASYTYPFHTPTTETIHTAADATEVAQDSGAIASSWSSNYTPYAIGAVGLLAVAGVAVALSNHSDGNDNNSTSSSKQNGSASSLITNSNTAEHVNVSSNASDEAQTGIIDLSDQTTTISLDSVLVANNHTDNIIAQDGTMHQNVLIIKAGSDDTIQTHGATQQGTVGYDHAEYNVYTYTVNNQNHEIWVNNEAIIA